MLCGAASAAINTSSEEGAKRSPRYTRTWGWPHAAPSTCPQSPQPLQSLRQARQEPRRQPAVPAWLSEQFAPFLFRPTEPHRGAWQVPSVRRPPLLPHPRGLAGGRPWSRGCLLPQEARLCLRLPKNHRELPRGNAPRAAESWLSLPLAPSPPIQVQHGRC